MNKLKVKSYQPQVDSSTDRRQKPFLDFLSREGFFRLFFSVFSK